MLEKELELEKDLFFTLNGSESIFLDNFFWLYSYKWCWIPFYACFLFVFFYKKNWKEIILISLSITLLIILCDQIASGFFKPFFERFRPTHHPYFREHVDMVFGYRGGGKYGFISSHASNAFGFATFTAFLFRNRIFTLTIILFALINGYSRIYLGVHFISDVIVGALIGIMCGYVVYQLYQIGRVHLLKTSKTELKHSSYTDQQAYGLCTVYLVIIIILLLFDGQLVNLLHP